MKDGLGGDERSRRGGRTDVAASAAGLPIGSTRGRKLGQGEIGRPQGVKHLITE